MALYVMTISVGIEVVRMLDGRCYQVLTKLDEDASILFQHLERDFGAAFMASPEHIIPLLFILNILSVVQSCSIAGGKSSSVTPSPWDKLTNSRCAYSLIHEAKAVATLPDLSTVS